MTKRPRVWQVWLWPRELPLPQGWRRAFCRPSRHDRWAVLLERVGAAGEGAGR